MSGPAISASFSHDALGRRTGKVINGVTTTSHYDGRDIVRESGGSGEALYLRMFAIDEALSRTAGDVTLNYLPDGLGSTVALADGSGGLSTTCSYAPFGETAVSGAP